jgi:hypothetical protein
MFAVLFEEIASIVERSPAILLASVRLSTSSSPPPAAVISRRLSHHGRW